jgi:hypothetical protein
LKVSVATNNQTDDLGIYVDAKLVYQSDESVDLFAMLQAIFEHSPWEITLEDLELNFGEAQKAYYPEMLDLPTKKEGSKFIN